MTATKLTKKQKKALAFREKRNGKAKKDDVFVSDGLDGDEVPIMELQDEVNVQANTDSVEDSSVGEKVKKSSVDEKRKDVANGKGKGKAEASEETPVAKALKKRRREVSSDPEEYQETRKRKKASNDDVGPNVTENPATKAPLKQRFILFVGNLKYSTTAETIKAHFAVCDPPPVVRLRTQRPSSSKKPIVPKSMGCAFVEFSHRNALQQGLKLHQSNLDGRLINVELTAGGGGKGETRLNKLRERNKSLSVQRKERREKQATKDGEPIPAIPDRPQRYSATSGLEQMPLKRRTWTVDAADDSETHKGARKHTKSRLRKEWGTGVNAIPVG